MHIAVLDDDVAYRNHMDRLLTRASDANKLKGLEGHYIDLYGNISALLPKIAMYDAIFIDVVEGEKKGHDLAAQIFHSGIQGKIILCISKIDYRNIISSDYSKHFLFMDKPINTDDLNAVLKVCDEKRAMREPQIEIRTKDETLYVKYEEFIYAKALVAGKTTIVLSGREDTIYYKDITMVMKSITEYPFMIAINKDTIVSTYHIKSVQPLSVTIDDGTVFRTSLKISNQLKRILNKTT